MNHDLWLKVSAGRAKTEDTKTKPKALQDIFSFLMHWIDIELVSQLLVSWGFLI